jgi:hypothetical protein
MLAALRTISSLAIVICLSPTGCLVSFTDYPVGTLGGPNGARGGSSNVTGSGGAGGLDAGGSDSPNLDAGGSDALVSDAGDAGGVVDAGGTSQGGSDVAGSGSPPSDLMIDDFEDDDSQILLNAGRNGSWFVLNDMAGVQTPAAHGEFCSLLTPARGASTRALHTTGSGFKTWGALVGADFVVNGTAAAAYDISAYQGVTFWAKLGKASATKGMRVSIRTYETVYACTSCGDHFGSVATLSDTFQSFQLPFSDMKQAGWGKPQVATFDLARAYAVIFGWGVDEPFDAWIDDLSFY